MHHPTDSIAHTTAFVTPVGTMWTIIMKDKVTYTSNRQALRTWVTEARRKGGNVLFNDA